MFHKGIHFLFIVSLVAVFAFSVFARENPKVLLKTSMGDIELELYPDKAPVSVDNFLAYVKEGFYKDVIFHRVIDGFMIQGGGFDKAFKRKETKDPIINEATNGLKNDRGTIAYARTQVVNSATSQFFINLVDNQFLNYKSDAEYGYAVFGKVVNGMNVVDKIGKTETHIYNGMKDVPVKMVVILSATLIDNTNEDKIEE